RIRYSFHDLSGTWFAPQSLGDDYVGDADFAGTLLTVSLGAVDASGRVAIVVAALSPVDNQVPFLTRTLTSDFQWDTAKNLPVGDQGAQGKEWLIPDEVQAQAAKQAPSSPINVCVLSRTGTYPWYCFDLKGTSFLAKPAAPDLVSTQSSPPVL